MTATTPTHPSSELGETKVRSNSGDAGVPASEISIFGVAPGSSPAANESIRPFQFYASDEDLADLRRRILMTRWPDRETVNDDTQGVQLATMQKLADYWASEYDWRKIETRLNSLPNFITGIDGLDIHFIHVRSKHEID